MMEANRLVHIWVVDGLAVCGFTTPLDEDIQHIVPWMVPCLPCAVESGYEGPAGIFPLTAEDRAREADVGFVEAVS